MTMHKPARARSGRLMKRASKAAGGVAERAALASTRDERIEFRVSPETKKLLIRAAELRGGNLTSFVLESAQERATDVIERYERLRLTDADRDRLLAALDTPPAPIAALKRAFQKHA
jgi:uncharacterized protein (DUF1778 family)